MLVKCPDCNKSRELERKRGSGICRPCSLANRKARSKKYFRVCTMCGDSKQVASLGDQSVKLCFDCYNKNRPKKETFPIVSVCIDCGVERKTRTSKATRCVSCAAKNRIKRIPMPKHIPKKKEKTMFVRTCPECEPEAAEQYVKRKKDSGVKPCRLHHIPKRKIPKPSKKKEISELAIAKAREVNKVHREAQVTKKTIPVGSSNEDMIAKFLKKQQPSVLIINEPMPHILPSSGLCASSKI